jgi:hypothetical protein
VCGVWWPVDAGCWDVWSRMRAFVVLDVVIFKQNVVSYCVRRGHILPVTRLLFRRTRCRCAWMWCHRPWMWCASYLDVVRVLPGCGAHRPWMWCASFWTGSQWCLDLAILCAVFRVLCFVFCVLCFVFCVLCFVFCVLCFVFCVFRVLCRLLLGVGKWWANYSHIDLSLARDRTLSAHHWPSTRVFLPVMPDCYFLFAVCSV